MLVALIQTNKVQAQTPTLTYPAPLSEYSPGQAIDFDVDLYSNGLIDQLCAVRYYIYKDDMTTPLATVTPYGTISYTVRGQGTNYVTNAITDGQGFIEVEALNDDLQAFTLGIFDNYCVDRDRPINIDMNFTTPGSYRFTVEIVSCSNNGVSTGTTFTATSCDGLVHTDSVSDTCETPVVLNTYNIDFTVKAPQVVYSALNPSFNTGDNISTSALVYSNGLVDELCGVRYAIYKDNATTPIDSVNDYGTVTYTVRGQGTALITTPLKAGQGYIEVSALNDTLQAFTLGIFDNYCIDRNRPIDIDMNFTVPGNYRFEAEIVSCGNAGISAGTTFTDQNCGGTLHTDSVAEECLNPVTLAQEEVETTVCGESELAYVSGLTNYTPGDSVELIYSLGDFDDAINATQLPAWLTYTIDNVAHTLTLEGAAPASNGVATTSFTITTASTINPSTCPTASVVQNINITAPSVTYSPVDVMYNTSEDISTTALVFSNGMVDELCGVRYSIYKDNATTPIDSVNDYGTVSYTVRGQGTTMVTNPIKAGQGYIEVYALNDTLQAFTLGIFDNFCLDRDRPIQIDMNFTVPGNYRFEAEIVSCDNAGTSTGTTFTDINCGGTVHTDSVAEECLNPVTLAQEEVETTICGEAEIAFVSGLTNYTPGDSVEFIYSLGDFDDAIDASQIPAWLTYSIDNATHTLTLEGVAPASDGVETSNFTIETASTINPASCPTASVVQNIIITAPSVTYTPINVMYHTSENISTSALVYSNGMVDELCGVRYAIYKDNSTTPIDSVNDYGTVTYTVRGQGTTLITTPLKTGEGYIEVIALNDTLEAFTLGIFDNFCINRNRPIDIDMNFTVPGNYRFEAEIISCGNAGISAGTTFTDINCGGTLHTDSVAEECLNPIVLTEGEVETTICGEASIAYVSGDLNYFPGQPVEIIYSVGNFDDGIDNTNLPTWLGFIADTSNNTITLTGIAPAYDALTPSYSFALNTTSSTNPATCPTATTNLSIVVNEGPEIEFTSINAVYNVGDSIYTTASIYSNGYVDELAAVEYDIYHNATLVNQVSDYGYMDYNVRVSGTNYDTTAIETGSGFITMSPVSDTLSAFTLGIFDNTCVNRNRPVNLFLTFDVPGEYVFNTELVSCANQGTATGTSFVATNCDNLIHYDSVAEDCLGPEMLFAETIGFTVCGESSIAYESGSDIYCAGTEIDLVYNVGDFDDGLNTTNLPSWMTYSVNATNHTISLHGTVPEYDQLNPTYTITLSTTSSENPAACPNASMVQTITVKESYRDTITEVICEGDSVVVGTTAYYTEGIYPNTLTAVNGCDSVVVLDLTVNPTVYSEFTVVTDSASYTWNSVVYDESGDYTQTLTSNITGCDSIVTLHLTITIGIDELNNTILSVYPNPTDNFVYVETVAKTGSQCMIEVHDVYGRVISSTEITENKTMIDLSNLASGAYFLKVMDGEKITGTAFVTKQ